MADANRDTANIATSDGEVYVLTELKGWSYLNDPYFTGEGTNYHNTTRLRLKIDSFPMVHSLIYIRTEFSSYSLAVKEFLQKTGLPSTYRQPLMAVLFRRARNQLRGPSLEAFAKDTVDLCWPIHVPVLLEPIEAPSAIATQLEATTKTIDYLMDAVYIMQAQLGRLNLATFGNSEGDVDTVKQEDTEVKQEDAKVKRDGTAVKQEGARVKRDLTMH